MRQLYIGIDPGASGGIACITSTGDPTRVIKIPDTDTELWSIFQELRELGATMCVIEKITAAPRRMGTETCRRCGHSWPASKAMNSPKSMLSQGTNYGLLKMGLIAAGIPFEEVSARKWQQRLALVGSGKETTTQKKNRHKDAAKKLFPHAKVTHYVADALLLAEYCRRENATAEPLPF